MNGLPRLLHYNTHTLCLFCIAAIVAFLGTCENLHAQHDPADNYPHRDLARQPKLDVAYALFLDGKYEGSIEELNRFMDYYPVHKNTDYAHYLKAVSYYKQISGRDAGSARPARDAIEVFLRDFPDSQYAEDASVKARELAEILAADHLSIGRFYQDRGALLGAIKRFQLVVREYPETTQTPEALHRLVESFKALGFRDIRPEPQRDDREPATLSDLQIEPSVADPGAANLESENLSESAELPVQVTTIAPEVSEQPFFAIHLSSVRNQIDTKPEWRRLQKRFPDLLENWELLVRSVELEERGIYYRVLAGPFTDYAKAQEVCAIFKSRHQHCLARRLIEVQSDTSASSG